MARNYESLLDKLREFWKQFLDYAFTFQVSFYRSQIDIFSLNCAVDHLLGMHWNFT